MPMRRLWRPLLYIGLFTAGWLAGIWLTPAPETLALNQLRDKNTGYSFISPLIACISPDKEYFSEYRALENKLDNYLSEQKRQGSISQTGVYFRDLTNGHWTGVDEGMAFFPASLFKVPIMMAHLKQAESDPDSLRRLVSYYPLVTAQNAVTALRPGKSYSIQRLLELMIIDSDNGAKDVLLDLADQRILNGILDDLDIDLPDSLREDEIYTISPRKYSLLFRALYNGTLLNKEMSERALALLSQTKFNDGLRQPVPAAVPIAHKFGSHVEPPIGAELHDCGIIYQKNEPYFLCVMTKGREIAKLPRVVQEVSRLVYEEVKK